MSILTAFFNLIKPGKGDRVRVSDLNSNFDTIDTEMHRPPLTVNSISPDESRNIYVAQVPLADNLASDVAQLTTGTYTVRTSGGGASIESGEASLVTVKGNLVRTGYVPESLVMTVNPAEREEGDPITATINRNIFVAYVPASTTITLEYTTAWSADPANYGITVTGTPINGDEIIVVYVKEAPGTITVANPATFNATGWNLFDASTGRAMVCAYSTQYGYRIGGNYSLLDFSPTLTGERVGVTVTGGLFNVPENGYIFVSGGDETTYIYPTWSDWTSGYQGNYETYTVDTINLAAAMMNFPFGLCAVGNVRDEININVQRAVQRIGRVANTPANLQNIVASGAEYIYDTQYIYYVLDDPVTTAIEIDGAYTVSDHGLEYFTGSSIPVYSESLYGENLKDKLRTDVLTISEQDLTAAQQAQVQENIDVPSTADLDALTDRVDAIGTIIDGTNAASMTVPNETTIEICSLELTPGIWLLLGHVAYSTTFDGPYTAGFYAGDSTTTMGQSRVRANAKDGSGLITTWVYDSRSFSTGRHIGLATYQKSGTNKTAAYIYLRAVKLA